MSLHQDPRLAIDELYRLVRAVLTQIPLTFSRLLLQGIPEGLRRGHLDLVATYLGVSLVNLAGDFGKRLLVLNHCILW